MSERHVTACIDGSAYSQAVCDAAAWASLRLDIGLTFVHVIDKTGRAAESDVSGQIGLGSREHLLAELAQLDEQRARLEREQGRIMLDAACERAAADGVANAASRQRHGALAETLVEMESETRLLVLGKRGETADTAHEHLGSNLERVIRSLHCPMLITPPAFKTPERIVVAFDGSRTSKAMIERIAASPLFAGVVCHLVFVGDASDDCRNKLDEAKAALEAVCGEVTIAVLEEGEVEATLRAYEQANDIDMLVMGAYGHSRIRHLLVGSTTTEMIRHANLPVLILR
ncbi:universal stress protein [uncultured Salinisphaera sp.]|uniref:universal stress protein n=1 Tax=uncultured Salinisphaera sp. TaxID=359372 RepID=UPI0032B24502